MVKLLLAERRSLLITISQIKIVGTQRNTNNTIEAGEIPIVALVRDGAVIPYIKLAQSTQDMDWNEFNLKVMPQNPQIQPQEKYFFQMERLCKLLLFQKREVNLK